MVRHKPSEVAQDEERLNQPYIGWVASHEVDPIRLKELVVDDCGLGFDHLDNSNIILS